MPSPQPLTEHDPRQIGPYWVTGYLGAGGQGTVYLAQAPNGTDVAVKTLHPHFARNPASRQRFLREVRAASKVSAYTARILDINIHHEAPYIASEFIPGESLAELVGQFGPRKDDELLRLATGTLSALTAIHAAGIVHCDFKPENVLRGPDGWRVIDFGIARALDTLEPNTSRRIGTAAYMAPEQINMGAIGPHSDLFAWGSTMVFAATGSPAFGPQLSSDFGGHAVTHRILEAEPDLNGLPSFLADLVAAALSKDACDRPTAQDALLTLLGTRLPEPVAPGGALEPVSAEPASAAAEALYDPNADPSQDAHDRAVEPAALPHANPPIVIAEPDAPVPPEPEPEAEPEGRSPKPGWGLSRRTLLVAALGALTVPTIPPALAYFSPDKPSTTDMTTLKGHTGGISKVVFSPDGRTLATASDDATVRLWQVTSSSAIATLRGHAGSVSEVVFSPDGRLLATASTDDMVVRLWDLGTGRVSAVLGGHAGGVSELDFSRDGTTLAVASTGNTVRLWDVTGRRVIATLKGKNGSVSEVAFSPDGEVLATASTDDTLVRLWGVAGRRITATLKGHVSSVSEVAFSPDGGILATASDDATVRLWDALSGKAVATLEGHTEGVATVAFSPEGKFLATAGIDKTVRLWEVGTRRTVATLKGHSSQINSVAFSPDGRIVGTASDDATVRLWDVPSGRAGDILEGHTPHALAVAFSPVGKVVATAGADNTVRLWWLK